MTSDQEPVRKIMKTINGKYVKIQRFKNKPTLCAVDTTTPGTKVEIMRHQTNQNQIAFKFSDSSNNNASYFAKASGNELKLEETDQEPRPPDSPDYWFERVNLDGSEYYGLKAVIGDQLYIITQNKPFKLGLSQHIGKCELFTDLQ